MTARLPTAYKRTEFTGTVRRAADARCKDHCEGCGKPLAGIRRVYDHRWPQRLGGASDLANCQVLCDDGANSCNSRKTHGLDLPGIAARKRHEKGRLSTDVGRPISKPGKIQSRGFQPGHRPMQSRPFPIDKPRAK